MRADRGMQTNEKALFLRKENHMPLHTNSMPVKGRRPKGESYAENPKTRDTSVSVVPTRGKVVPNWVDATENASSSPAMSKTIPPTKIYVFVPFFTTFSS